MIGSMDGGNDDFVDYDSAIIELRQEVEMLRTNQIYLSERVERDKDSAGWALIINILLIWSGIIFLSWVK